MRLEFICGCSIDKFDGKEDPEFWNQQLEYDDEGFVICKTHKVRRYGWRIPSANDVRNGASFGRFGMDALAYERFILFGTPPVLKKAKINFNPSLDRRDNRMPESVRR
jgi:hypothetical protein